MPFRMVSCVLLAVLLTGCGNEKPARPTVVPPPPPPPEAPAPTAEQFWVLLVRPLGATSGGFFARMVLREGSVELRDGTAEGFAAARYSEKPGGGFVAEQESPTAGRRTWHCVGSPQLCTLYWAHDGKTDTLSADGLPQEGGPFEGEWPLTLTPEDGAGPGLSGNARFDHGALDLSVGNDRHDGLVYWVRPPSPGTPADFFTVPSGTHAPVEWYGTLMERGAPVAWDQVKDGGQYSVGGQLIIREPGGATRTYRVSSQSRRQPATAG